MADTTHPPAAHCMRRELATVGVRAGRVIDLTLRWSINNTVRSLTWMAVPSAQQLQAKPWVEGTLKKMTGSVVAALIGCAALLPFTSPVSASAAMSLLVAAASCAACFKLHALQTEAMWQLIERRDLQLCDKELLLEQFTLEGSEAAPTLDADGAKGVLRKLRGGKPH
eukprot:6203563-Pleurochrysis_carterae.AAC.1